MATKAKPSFTNFIFVDMNEEYSDALKNRLKDVPNVNIICNDCNSVASAVLSMMDTDDPCFIFLDPFGLELKWKTVEELSRKRRIDILVNFPVGAIHRCMTIEGAESTVTECLGCDEWKKFRGKGASVRISLRDLYTRVLSHTYTLSKKTQS